MLTDFDWIRRVETGAELIATLEYLAASPSLFADDMTLGPPQSALSGPCRRCWVYTPFPLASEAGTGYCKACRAILNRAKRVWGISRGAIIIWGYVNRLPRRLAGGEGFYREHTLGQYVHDSEHFLLVMRRQQLKSWLEDLALYDGGQLKGLFQIFPTSAQGKNYNMGDILCRAIYYDSRFAMDQLRVRFYSAPYQLLRPRARDEQGILTFEAAEFLSLLEMASIFRSLLAPEEQKMLLKLLSLENQAEQQFYWGRFWGYLNQEKKDMLAAWNIRQWPLNQVKLLYEIVDYVGFYQTN